MEYFIIVTCITAATGILGLMVDPGARLGYEAFFSPLIFGLVSLVPSLLTYHRRELSFRQAVVRKALHLLSLEACLTGYAAWSGLLPTPADAFQFAVTVLFVYLLVNAAIYVLSLKEANEINKGLRTLQGRD